MEIKWVVFFAIGAIMGAQWASWAYDLAYARLRGGATRIAIGILFFAAYLIAVRGWFLIIRDGPWALFQRWLQ